LRAPLKAPDPCAPLPSGVGSRVGSPRTRMRVVLAQGRCMETDPEGVRAMSVPQLQPDVGVVPMPALSPAVVSASGLVRRYGEGDTAVDALRDVSIEIEEARLTAIMGPSGSGKSTLMHILAGLDQPSEGSVSIAGVEITGMNDKQLTRLRREHIGCVFQFFNLLPMLTAEENILL